MIANVNELTTVGGLYSLRKADAIRQKLDIRHADADLNDAAVLGKRDFCVSCGF